MKEQSGYIYRPNTRKDLRTDNAALGEIGFYRKYHEWLDNSLYIGNENVLRPGMVRDMAEGISRGSGLQATDCFGNPYVGGILDSHGRGSHDSV